MARGFLHGYVLDCLWHSLLEGLPLAAHILLSVLFLIPAAARALLQLRRAAIGPCV